MATVALFDENIRLRFLPFTYSRPVSAIRLGIFTISEKWRNIFHYNPTYLTAKYLNSRFSFQPEKDTVLVKGSIVPDKNFVDAVSNLEKGEALWQLDQLLAANLNEPENPDFSTIKEKYRKVEYDNSFFELQNIWDIFKENGAQIKKDFESITLGRASQPLPDNSTYINRENIFIEEGAKVSCAIINAMDGPVYIGKDAKVLEGSIIRGPFALCEHGEIKMGAKIYSNTTVGPHTKVGGEVNNVVFLGYSNKAHDGFLGNSVIGEWVNIGADSNNSNLKNNYDKVKIWSYETERFINTGEQFCGLMMGDHSKCGINTMFNTGTEVGFSANVFGAGFPRTFIPSFSWGGASGFITYKLDKALETAERMMGRRNITLTNADKEIFQTIFDLSSKYRKQ